MPSASAPILVIKPRPAGFFSLFLQVVGNVAWAAEHQHRVYVDFSDDRFLYRDPADADAGTNGWEHFFQQPDLLQLPHDPVAAPRLEHDGYTPPGSRVGIGMTPDSWAWNMNPPVAYRHYVHELIHRHIRLQPALEASITATRQRLFTTRPICGVHVRRTDSTDDNTKRPPRLADFHAEIDRYRDFIQAQQGRTAAVFLATDEAAVVTDFRARYGDDLILADTVTRSTDGTALHANPSHGSGRQLGTDVVLECYLLSASDHLVHSNSNVSSTALYLNPALSSTYLPPRPIGLKLLWNLRRWCYRRLRRPLA